MDDKSPPAGSAGKPAKPVVRGKGKGKALNAIAALSGRDPADIVKSVTDAESAAKAAAARAQAEEDAKKAAEARAQAKAKEEVSAAQIYGSLSPQDQYRFECYRRCGFASKPIEKFVAKMLVDEAEKRYLARRGAMVGLGGTLSGGADAGHDNAPSNLAVAVTDTSDADSNPKKLNASRKRKKQSKKHILREETKRRRAAMDQPLPYFLGGGSNRNGSGNHVNGVGTPPLENLVVPNSASEIVAVVSTLAKCYGQRLVAAAKRVADAEEEEKKINGTISADASPTTPNPLLPHHFLAAHRHRARAGIDPGFWMADRIEGGKKGLLFKTGGAGVEEAAALGTVDRDRACHLAALAAQDAFDKETEKEEDSQQCTNDKMEVDAVGKDGS
ncbi:hypothetical protein ACHAXR_002060 [Thalassiosira sp. AJA248-18]